MSSTITNDSDGLRVIREARVLILARYFIGQMLDGLVGVERTVEHVHLLLEDCQIAAVGAVFNVEDGVLVVLYLFDHAGVLDVEDSQHSRLEAGCEEEALGVRGEAQAEVV